MSSTSNSTPSASFIEELIRNSTDESVPWVVQKFGGTSVGKFLDNICKIVESYIPESRVALVCSARSADTKALGTTNLLLQASREALQPVSARPGSISGSQTPYFPKRVGSGFFGPSSTTFDERPPRSGFSPNPSASGASQSSNLGGKDRDMSASMMSSITSLKELELRSSSPSPFTPSGRRSPTSPTTPGVNGFGKEQESVSRFHETVDTLKKAHLVAARKSVRQGFLRDELEEEIERDCEWLRGFLQAAQTIDEISPRSQDSIVGIGEKLACKIVAAALRDRGIDSELVVLDNIVDAAISTATEQSLSSSGDQGVAQLGQEFYDQLAVRLGERLRECGGRVPVITGYFGPVPGSLLAQIGRGYTDLCAALCAVGVGAKELQVWKEVDGIFTADPRKVKDARLVPVITPDEAAELTYYGSEVIHPFTMEQVIRASIPIRIKNVEKPQGGGTVIFPDTETGLAKQQAGDKAVDEKEMEDEERVERAKIEGKMPTAVTIKDNIIVVNIHSNRKTISHGFLARIFGTLDRAGVVVDLISTSEVHVSMALQDFEQKHRLERLKRDLERIGDVTVTHDMAILSLVGRNMRRAIGSAGAMFTSLAKANINIDMISQGASEINISCADAINALQVIHASCLVIPPPSGAPSAAK